MCFVIRNAGRSSIAPLSNAKGAAKAWNVILKRQIGNTVHGNALKGLGMSPCGAQCAAKGSTVI